MSDLEEASEQITSYSFGLKIANSIDDNDSCMLGQNHD